jgi:hypothetical protein
MLQAAVMTFKDLSLEEAFVFASDIETPPVQSFGYRVKTGEHAYDIVDRNGCLCASGRVGVGDNPVYRHQVGVYTEETFR